MSHRNALDRMTASKSKGREGPRTAEGKARVSRNALRHGLSAVTHVDPTRFSRIKQIADAICGHSSDPLLHEQAMIIAAASLQLRCIRGQRVYVIDRLWNETAIALSKGDNSIKVA